MVRPKCLLWTPVVVSVTATLAGKSKVHLGNGILNSSPVIPRD